MKTIKLIHQGGLSIPAQINFEIGKGYYGSETNHVHLSCENFEINGEDIDFFDAFCHVRQELEQRGFLPFCYGASRNVYPSGRCRDWFGGLLAYKMTMGQVALLEDLVGIFNMGDDVDPATVKEQEEYHRAWLSSLKKTK
jgi:hypothetical protein